jgi:hypothetical protein
MMSPSTRSPSLRMFYLNGLQLAHKRHPGTTSKTPGLFSLQE